MFKSYDVQKERKQILLLVGTLFIGCAIWAFLIGWHNIDLAFNATHYALIYNLDYFNLRESLIDGSIITYDKLYVQGFQSMVVGLLTAILGGLYLAWGLDGNYYKTKN